MTNTGYLIEEIRPGIIFEPKGGGTFTLVQAMREVYGMRGVRIVRADAALTPVVESPGSDMQFTHVPSGRVIRR